jgi:hypothetical protein
MTSACCGFPGELDGSGVDAFVFAGTAALERYDALILDLSDLSSVLALMPRSVPASSVE